MGFQNERRVPFTIPTTGDESLDALFAGSSSLPVLKASGLIGLEPDHLSIQIRPRPRPTRDPSWWSSFGELFGTGEGRSGSKRVPTPAEEGSVAQIEIPLGDLASAHIKGRWGRVIILRTNDLSHFSCIPGALGDSVQLHVARRDRERAEELVSSLQMRLSDLGLEHLDAQIERLENPTRTPLDPPSMPPSEP